MSETPTLLYAVITGIVAVAFLMQSLALWGVRRAIQNVSSRVDDLSRDLSKTVDSVSVTSQDLVSSIRVFTEKLGYLQDNLNATTAVIHKRVVDLDAFVEETTSAARLQVVRIQELVETASQRIEETLGVLQKGVLGPVNEVQAVAVGVKAGLNYLLRQRKNPAGRSHQDEEMFI
jgi:methyl-accepting chemotaxis protein